MTLITDAAEAAAFCRRLSEADVITVDTEFLREKTFWPRLCLVQIAGPDEAAAIDPLAEGMNLSPVFELMSNEKILKVFHAARQDLEIFHHLMGHLPKPLFDTQLAAMVCGFGDSVSYETLVAKLAKKRVDKSSRFTDWSVRPLSERQITYALSDVTHLRVVYAKLAKKLAQNNREAWLAAEVAVLGRTETYVTEPDLSYKRIKTRTPTPRFLAILREVAAWREREAQTRNMPRGHILRDESMLEIAHHTPKTVDALARIRGMGRRLAEGSRGAELLKLIEKGTLVPDADCPQPPPHRDLPRGIGPLTDLLKVLLKMRCEDADVAQRLVASSADLELLAADGEKAGVPALEGWRREVFGDSALKLRSGEIALAANGRKVIEFVVEKTPETDADADADA